MRSSEDDRMLLRHEFCATADWRLEKANQYPSDSRNRQSAKLLEKLAATIEEIPSSIFDVYRAMFRDVSDSERHSELLVEVGFSWHPDDATEFVRRFINDRPRPIPQIVR